MKKQRKSNGKSVVKAVIEPVNKSSESSPVRKDHRAEFISLEIGDWGRTQLSN